MKPTDAQPVVAYVQPARLECIDSLRGLAALAVLLGHVVGAFAWPPNLVGWCEYPLINMMFDGRSAVTMFFILSGFVLAHPYLAPVKDGQPPRPLFIPTFYIRRFTRIWPPWFAVFVLSAIARKYFFAAPATIPPTSEWVGAFWHVPPTGIAVLQQCVFVLHDARRMLLPQDGSLGVELRGSALIPLYLFLVRKNISILAVLVALLLVFHPTGEYYASFALGVWVAKYYHRIESRLAAVRLRTKWSLLAAGVLLYESRLAASYYWVIDERIEKIVWCLASVGCALILAASLSSRRIQAKLNWPVVLLLGRISYSLYLLQFVVILCLLPPVIHGLNAIGLQNRLLLLPLTVGMGVLLTAGLATISYRWVESPSIHFGRWLTKLIQKRITQTPQVKPDGPGFK